ncbi:FRG domain-containing protein [Rhodovulum sp. 12E13]|uniref:FRG domain-containing protein n=1 Tax=Rhodovulum sp. 12E13 TaxID=2203891 RepID=UPI000E14C3FF|nr:FRG domain-containing protein [Rhodovulum sp. 12E13]
MSLADFLKAVSIARDELKCSESGAWFRGVRYYRHRLYPSLLRPTARIHKKREKDIYHEYSDFSDNESASERSWDRLVKLQHFGVPTRLLDWTEVLGMAVYFAVRDLQGSPKEEPAVWIINPFQISYMTRQSIDPYTKDTSIGDFHNQNGFDYYENFILKQSWPRSSTVDPISD